MRTRFAFLHVPKSAGSSVKNAVVRRCDTATVAPCELDRVLFGGFDRFDDMPDATRAVIAVDGAAALAGYEIAMGHFAVSSFGPHFARDEMMTVLREPRTRLLSHFTFWRSWSSDRHDDWAPYAASRRAVEATWEAYLTDRSISSQTDNLTVRMLLSPHPLIPVDDFIAPDDHDELAREAIGVLDAFGFVDVVESGAMLWSGLSTWLDADVEPERSLVTDPPGDLEWVDAITPGAAAALTARTVIDARLWAHVAERNHGDAAALSEATFHRKLAGVAAATAVTASLVDENRSTPSGSPRRPTERARRLFDRLGR